MKYQLSVVALGILLSTALGCASTNQARDQALIRESLGVSSYDVIIGTTRDALRSRNGYAIFREVLDAEDIRIDTDWKEVSSLPDERALGFSHARSKILVSARPRNRTAGTFSVHFEAEVQVRRLGSDVWEWLELTEDRRTEIRNIARDMRTVLVTAR